MASSNSREEPLPFGDQGNRDEGYAKYQAIADNYYAASSYRNVKRWLTERK